MKTTFLISFICLSSACLASSYNWIDVDIINGSIGGSDIRTYSIYGCVYSGYEYLASTEGPLAGYKDGNGFYLKQKDHKTTQQKVDNNVWIAAYYGELLCAETFSTADPIPLCNWYDSTTENGQFISNADDFYLAFMSTGSQSEDGIDRYGWFHVALDDNMEMSILESGIGLYGESIYVGATPEPTAGLLLLLGSAFLALRRRKAA